jgi:hypothetical protein
MQQTFVSLHGPPELTEGVSPGSITSIAWTSDGYSLAVGYEKGWAVWSMGGRLGGWGLAQEEDEKIESFMCGIKDLVGTGSRLR